MREWLTKQNTSAIASVFISLVTLSLGWLMGESVLRFLALLFLAHGVVVLSLEWLRSAHETPEVGEILILDREEGKRTAQEVAFSSLLVYNGIVELMELKGIATRREFENKLAELKERYRAS